MAGKKLRVGGTEVCVADERDPETRKLLESIDYDKSGYISSSELSRYMRMFADVQTQQKPGTILMSQFSAEQRKILEVFDTDKSGEINAVELQMAAQLYAKEKTKTQHLGRLVMILSFFVLLFVGINAAMSFVVVDLAKDTKVGNGKLADRSSGEMLATGAFVLPHKPDYPTEVSANRHRALLDTEHTEEVLPGEEQVVFHEFAFDTAALACQAMCKGSLDLLVDTEHESGQTMEHYRIVRREGCTCADGASSVVNDELTAILHDTRKNRYTVICHGGTTCTVSTSAAVYDTLLRADEANQKRRRGRSLLTSEVSERSLQWNHMAIDHSICPEMCMNGDRCQEREGIRESGLFDGYAQKYKEVLETFGYRFCRHHCHGGYCKEQWKTSRPAPPESIEAVCTGCWFHLSEVTRDPNPTLPACFPANATVVLEDGHKTASIHEVKVGDRVLSVDATGNVVFSDVWYPGHADRTGMFDYLQIKTEAGAVIELSHGHYIPTIRSKATAPTAAHEYSSAVTIQAQSVRVGDVVFQTRADSKTVGQRVVEINEVTREGLYNPMVLEGTIVVDGVVASAYAKWCFEYVIPLWMIGYNDSAYAAIQHAWFAPMRAVYKAMGAKWVQDLVVNMSHGDLYYGDSFARNLLSFWQPYWMVVRAFALQYLFVKA